MKLLLAAAAFAVAAPAAAQAAPAAPTQGAGQHQGMQGMDHSQHGRGQHQGHDMKDGCCADKDGNGKMDCCEKKDGQPQAAPRAPSRN